MPQSAIQICNAALIKLGESSITSFSDGTKASELCFARYPALRDQVLRSHNWRFSMVVVPLSPLSTASDVSPWLYQYTLPTTCSRIVGVSSEDVEIRYERIGSRIHAMEEALDLRYVRNYATADDGVGFPDDFAEVVASILSAELAVSLTQNLRLRETCLLMFKESLATARFNGSVEQSEVSPQASSWLDAHDHGAMPDTDPRLRGLSGY